MMSRDPKSAVRQYDRLS